MSLPLIAILRGVTPDKIINTAQLLIDEGFTKIEVPLNSPNALTSIKKLVDEYGNKLLVGAGTVTTPTLAQKVIDTGANLIVTPNLNEQVVKMAIANNCECYPGVVTPSEAFAAISAGATHLKLFPISALGLDGFKALKSVLPADVKCFPVGGIDPNSESMFPLLKAGAEGFGLGSSLYKPHMDNSEIRQNAQRFVDIYKQFNQQTH
jgi:2-dehydro-3-deoxyphosphogalactonate aldolase